MKRTYKASLLALPLMLITALLTACSGSSPGSGDSRKVVLLTVTQQCEYCAAVQNRIESQLREAGYEVSAKLTDYDAAEQAQQANQTISERPDAVMMWPADSTAAAAPIQKMESAGIPVIVFNSQPESPEAAEAWTAFTGPDDTLMGSQAAIALVDGIKEKGLPMTGQVAVINGVPGTTPAIKRLEGFQTKMAEIAPELDISTVVASDSWDQAGATGVAASIVNRIPADQLRGVFGAYDPFVSAFIVAAKQAGMNPADISTVGVVCTGEGKRNIENGEQYATVLQSPEDEATYAVEAVEQAMSGEAPEKVRYLPAEIVTKANVGDCVA